jgi:hypothetical protein
MKMKLSELKAMNREQMMRAVIEREALLVDIATWIWENPDPANASADDPIQEVADWVRPYWRNDPVKDGE